MCCVIVVGCGTEVMVGIAMDEAVGKNSGEVKGVKYFDCLPRHGLMVKQSDVTKVSVVW